MSYRRVVKEHERTGKGASNAATCVVPNGSHRGIGEQSQRHPAHPGSPDLWAYSAGGRLLAALPAGANGAVFNDVTVARDGAAYFTDSSLTPRIFRVAQQGGSWTVETWLDATGTVPTQGDFSLNGIAATRDGKRAHRGAVDRCTVAGRPRYEGHHADHARWVDRR